MRRKKSFEFEKRADFDPKSFCWRGELQTKYESFWSLLQKFALLNAINGTTIREIFGLALADQKDCNWKDRDRADLRYLSGFDKEKLKSGFRLSDESLNKSVVEFYVKKSEIKILSHNNLRFCYECLKDGFHSAIYQLLFFQKCPYHNSNFQTNCPNCGNDIPYQLNKTAFNNPYSCSTCRHTFCEQMTKLGGKLSFSKSREVSLKLLSDWLICRSNSFTIEKPITISSISSLKKTYSEMLLNNLSTHWFNVFGASPKLKNILRKQKYQNEESIHVRGSFKAIIPEEKLEYSDSKLDIDLYSIYKSISRQFLKTHLFNHSNCIENLGRTIWWDKATLHSQGKVCVYANAFLLWRMYFESVRHPIDLFRKFKGYVADRSKISWQPPSYKISKAIIKKIFSLECYWAFYECKLLATEFNEKNIYSFNTVEYIKNDLLPHWTVELYDKKNSEENYYIYYCYELSRLKKLNEFSKLH